MKGAKIQLGVQGWYASAVLSSLLLLDWQHPLLKEDLTRLVNASPLIGEDSKQQITTVLELGSVTISLVGMTMTWILAQKQQQQACEASRSKGMVSRVILTDCDSQCLDRLGMNADYVRNALQKHFGAPSYNINLFPDLQVHPLDWNSCYKIQKVLDKDNNGSIDLILGAALVYTADGTSVCGLQLAKLQKKSQGCLLDGTISQRGMVARVETSIGASVCK